jgi:pimeloyl-ACP methyl ester carboxylesterase
MKILRLLAVAALAACGDDSDGPSGPVDTGEPPAAGCTDGTLSGGALFRYCFPATWNGEVVIYAHGYVQPGTPIALPADDVGGLSVSSVVTSLGYAFATTSYRANGLVADVAVDDLVELDEEFRERYRPDPTRTYVVGASEGGLVAALAVERDPARFAGALAVCGPVGDFGTQIDYFGDFRVVFDYFFPGVLPGSAVEIPDELQANWESQYVAQVTAAIEDDPAAAGDLIAVTGASVENAGDPASIAETAVAVLWYSVYATEDAQARLGGQPYDNSVRLYAGSADDEALNAGVARHAADPAARQAIADFDTSGDLDVPVVTLHTTEDPIVPFLHEALYAAKVSAAGASDLLEQRTANRFGHCVFDPIEVQLAFAALVELVS